MHVTPRDRKHSKRKGDGHHSIVAKGGVWGFSLSGPAEVEKVSFQVSTDFNICAKTFVEACALILVATYTIPFGSRTTAVV